MRTTVSRPSPLPLPPFLLLLVLPNTMVSCFLPDFGRSPFYFFCSSKLLTFFFFWIHAPPPPPPPPNNQTTSIQTEFTFFFLSRIELSYNSNINQPRTNCDDIIYIKASTNLIMIAGDVVRSVQRHPNRPPKKRPNHF